MKKRILCAILSLILLVSIIPAGALTASAASNKTSEKAITVLKQLQGYRNTCSDKGYWGYGTECTEKATKSSPHGSHKISEKKADQALREELKEIDKALNSFASSNSLSLSQNKHDALALFTFRNGTAWMSGTGDVKRAVTTKATGNDFLTMFCNWQNSDADNERRLIEANMYLNGVYSTAKPSRFIRVKFDANGGKMAGENVWQYFDYTLKESKLPIPKFENHIFRGWYNGENWIQKLTSSCDNAVLTAEWQDDFDKDDKDKLYDPSKVKNVNYTLHSSKLATAYIYDQPGGTCFDSVSQKGSRASVEGNLNVVGEYIDGKGVKWCKIGKVDKYTYKDKNNTTVYEEFDFASVGYRWVKVGVGITDGSGSSGDVSSVKVTVTNSYVNARKEASIYAAKCGSYSQGQKVTIVGTPVEKNGFLWGKTAEDGWWIALMYTNYAEAVKGEGSSNSGSSGKVIAKAVIKEGQGSNYYVNVRSGAGTDNQIVGALTANTMVDIYEIKYVNGHQWGRCSKGWFLLAYADVTRLVDEGKGETGQIGFTSYTFNVTLYSTEWIFTEPSNSSAKVDVSSLSDSLKKLKDGDQVTVTNITADSSGNTWGKIPQGWIMLFDADGKANNISEMSPAKFQVIADSASVRKGPATNEERVDTLSKGTEFNVTKIKATVDTIWGYSDKVGENENDTYSGWVNLSSRYVKRTNGEAGGSGGSSSTGKVATVTGANEVNVRSKADIYGNVVCKVKLGETYAVKEGPVNGWYRLKISGYENKETWVYKQYLEVKSASSGSDGSSGSGSNGGKIETGKGIIANTYTGVNMRQTPGTAGAFMGKITTGTAVDIQEVKQVGSSKWGKVTIQGKTGWICMDYVTMISYEEVPNGGGSGSNGGSGSTGGSGGNTVTKAEPAIYTGKIKTKSGDNSVDPGSENGNVSVLGRSMTTGKVIVYKTTDINGPVVRELGDGDPITMHEILTVEEKVPDGSDKSGSDEYEGDNDGSDTIITRTGYWARINDGYIRAPGDNVVLDTLDEAVYTVVDHDKLYAYTGPDMTEKKTVSVEGDDFNGEQTLTLKKGDQVTVTEVVIVGNVISGKVETETGDFGWVNLSKLSKGALNVKVDPPADKPTNPTTAPTKPIGDDGNTGDGGFVPNPGGYKYTGKVINTNSVNVRSTASTSASITATLKNGASLVIYETTISEGMAWGRCDAGWVYLYYVDMTPAGGSAIDARVVYNDNTIIYTDSACSDTAGTYARMAVIDIYEVVGKMARTDKGWVNTDNLL